MNPPFAELSLSSAAPRTAPLRTTAIQVHRQTPSHHVRTHATVCLCSPYPFVPCACWTADERDHHGTPLLVSIFDSRAMQSASTSSVASTKPWWRWTSALVVNVG